VLEFKWMAKYSGGPTRLTTTLNRNKCRFEYFLFVCQRGGELANFTGMETVNQNLVIQSIYRWCTVVSWHWNDEKEVENVARGRIPRGTFSTEVHHISMSHERPCFMCFVVWPTTSLKLYIVFWDAGETRVSIVCHLQMHRDLITVRG